MRASTLTSLRLAKLLAAGLLASAPINLSLAADPVVQTLYNRVQMVTYRSTVLNQNKSFTVVLPQNYDAAVDDWPVLFFLHGSGRHERSLVDVQSKRDALKAGNYVTILPDGDSSWWIDSPYGDYGTYLEETFALAESLYKLTSDPNQRAITGWSMGGYGAVRYAQTHADEFSAVSPIIGVIDYPRDQSSFPEDQRYDIRTDIFTSNPSNWPAHNPVNFVENISDMSIQLITGNTAFDRTMNQNFSAQLTAADIDHTLTILEGGHSFDVTLENAIPLVVAHTNAVFAGNPLGDFNSDGAVDLADYTVWRDQLGFVGAGFAADGHFDGVVDANDYEIWKLNFGSQRVSSIRDAHSIPEPSTLILLASLMTFLVARSRRGTA
jgi:S-formylglutathione hydrolase FrmB